MVVQALGLAVAAAAVVGAVEFNCQMYDIEDLDRTHIATFMGSTPPSRTNQTVYFNPCGPVRGVKDCAPDDQFCVLEWVEFGHKWELTKAIPAGSREANATLDWFYDSYGFDRNNGGPSGNGMLALNYFGALWGDMEPSGSVTIFCGPEYDVSLSYGGGENWGVTMHSPLICQDSHGTNPGDAPREERRGWGFFTYLFVLALVGAAAYGALALYLTAQSRGAVSTDIGEILRELPYLFRDVVRRVSESLSSRRAGYSAI